MNLGIWVRKNYRLMMIIFIALSAILYRYSITDFENTKYTQAGLALLIRYMLTLADYIFHFTMSLADSRGNAISIERVR